MAKFYLRNLFNKCDSSEPSIGTGRFQVAAVTVIPVLCWLSLSKPTLFFLNILPQRREGAEKKKNFAPLCLCGEIVF
jgi:hypothetical protein